MPGGQFSHFRDKMSLARDTVVQFWDDPGHSRTVGKPSQSTHLTKRAAPFHQTRCTFGQLCKPNPNPNSKTNHYPNPNPMQVRCMIDQILRNSSNGVHLINWSVAQRVWSNAQLTKCLLQLNRPKGISRAQTRLDSRDQFWWRCVQGGQDEEM